MRRLWRLIRNLEPGAFADAYRGGDPYAGYTHPVIDTAVADLAATTEDVNLLRERLYWVEKFGPESATGFFLMVDVELHMVEIWARQLREAGNTEYAGAVEIWVESMRLWKNLPADLREASGMPVPPAQP